MGYYFEKAKTRKELNEEQLSRYQALRSSKEELPLELTARIEEVRAHIGLLTSGEVMSALEELVQDAFIAWVLAGEDPSKVEWVDPDKLIVPTPPPTEEEKRRAAEWSENFMRQLREHEVERQQNEADWRTAHPIRYFFRQLAERLSRR